MKKRTKILLVLAFLGLVVILGLVYFQYNFDLLEPNFKFELAAKDIYAKVAVINNSTKLKIFKLNNNQLLDILGGPAYDNGREITGYFKNGHIQKIFDEIGLSFGPRRFTHYFDNNELIYTHETEENYFRNQDGDIDYERPLVQVFDVSYLFFNGKLIDQITEGKRVFTNDIDSKDIQKRAKEDLDLLTKQYQAK